MACKQQIPNHEALLLEFPGFAQNVQAALDSFGGQDAVSELLAGARQALQLRFRPGDPLAHPILGLKQQAQGILLRLSPTAGQEERSGNAAVQAEVVAHVKRCVRFSGMADFQYASCGHRPQDAQASAPPGLLSFEPEPLLTTPQLFSKQDVPLDYAFRSYYGSDPDHFKAGVAAGKGIGRMAGHVISFQSLHVLPPLEQTGAAGPPEEVGLKIERRHMLRVAAALFSKQAIRSQLDLQGSVPGLTGQDADVILPRLAYMFRNVRSERAAAAEDVMPHQMIILYRHALNGPWKGLWVKRGYDPRSDAASAVRQALQLPGRARGGVMRQTTSSTLYQEICRLSMLPENSTALPAGDIQKEAVASLLASAERLLTCDVKTGWLSEEDYQRLQTIVSALLQRLNPTSGPAQPGSFGQLAGQGQPDRTHQQQMPASRRAGADVSTDGQSAQNLRTTTQPADVHMSSQGADRSGQQPGQSQEREANGKAGKAVAMENDGAEQPGQEGPLPDLYLQEILAGWAGDAPVANISPEAAQMHRAAVQEDFELLEGSEDGDEIEQGTAEDTEEGEDEEESGSGAEDE